MPRLIVVGIGGPSCSGKSTLAAHLSRVLRAPILHQDDFAPREADIPVHAVHGVKDWDDPDTAIEWERMRAALDRLRAGGGMAHASFEYLNSERTGGVDLPAGVEERWSAEFARIRGEGEGGEVEEVEEVKFVLVDGFVLYYDANVRAALDVPLMLRVPAPTLKARREARAVYALQNEEDAAAGAVWTDPPGYFDAIVYPAYVKAHASLFAGGDVEAGAPVAKDVTVLTPEGENGMGDAFESACAAVLAAVRSGAGSSVPKGAAV